MAGNKTAIKSRIKSINSTKKITGAMELIASVKLTKNRSAMFKNRTYADAIKDVVAQILDSEGVNHDFLSKKDNPKTLYFVFTSDMGLCGGYNINLAKLLAQEVKIDDCLYFCGLKHYDVVKRMGYQILNEQIGSDDVDYLYLKKLADSGIEMYRKNEIGSIKVLYTHFVNNVSFTPTVEEILPCEKVSSNKEYKEVLFEPSPGAILDELLPMMVESEIYARFLESKTSEHGSRRFAMENATDNANELTDQLLLAYNQARQAAITQEITEIVSGADAL